MTTRPPVFSKFREVQEELGRSGRAIYRDANGIDSLIVRYPYSINYIHSYAEDTEFFLALADGKLKGSKCTRKSCRTVYATPRGHCMACGAPTEWIDLPPRGRLHSWTTCHYGS
ncbi:cytoplasmic protein, partial [mine drainage metagenome]